MQHQVLSITAVLSWYLFGGSLKPTGAADMLLYIIRMRELQL
jgi:hypothetical protein